jgi:hypothetical protein
MLAVTVPLVSETRDRRASQGCAALGWARKFPTPIDLDPICEFPFTANNKTRFIKADVREVTAKAPNAKARPVARTRCISMGMSEPCGMVRTAVMNRPTRMMTA